jgi:hypothetical protein
LLPCPNCSCHVRRDAASCPHCQERIGTRHASAAVIALGLLSLAPGCLGGMSNDYGTPATKSWTTPTETTPTETTPEDTGSSGDTGDTGTDR